MFPSLIKKAVETAVEIARLSGAKLYAVYVIVAATRSPRDFGWERAAMEHFRKEANRLPVLWKRAQKLPE
jgi:nucleotide-binding universal stress UspA family protein